ncbi:MAG: sugar ABC transporter ATP-binding protein [Phycisphaeraceae bacterium]|nr:MAG: sugar ABC transporter ATP-binding protein [Phycisphaeraceae bacterium]
MAEVRVSNVWKVYPGGVEAVRDVSIEIPDGSFVVLVGPSGCGKSTTLRMIAGLEEISKGEISIGDRVVNGVHPKDRDIAMVFQNYALYPHMSVYKNMAFALKLRGMKKAEIDKRVRHASAILGLDELLDRKPKALSGGQRQRVAVGRCIVREPKAFLFDEPLSNLDAKLRVSMRGELKSLHQRLKTTTVYVTHDQEEAMTLGDKVVVMSEGVVQQADTPFEVYQHPVNRFVAGFIGTPPMNFIEGHLVQNDGNVEFVEDGEDSPERPLLRIRPHKSHREALAGAVGSPVVLGLRPQAVTEAAFGELHDKAKAKGRLMRLAVDVVEPLGDQMDVHGHTATVRMTARISAHGHLPTGGEAKFAVDTERLHYFEPGEFGKSLTLAERAEPVGA